MMIKTYLLLFFVISCQYSIGQEKIYSFDYQAIYKYSYQMDSLNIESRNEELMELLIDSKGLSFFQAYNKGLRDSIILADNIDRNKGIPVDVLQKTDHNINATILHSGQHFITRDSYINTLGREKDYLYYQENLKLNWELLDEIDSINGITVQKAICRLGDHKWTAWFAPEINLPYGPYKFSGLPGLIIKISDDKGYFSYEMIGITNKTNLTIIFPDEEALQKKYITKAQFLKDKYYYLSNRTMIDIQNKASFFQDLKLKQEYIMRDKEKLKKYNIWIERLL